VVCPSLADRADPYEWPSGVGPAFRRFGALAAISEDFRSGDGRAAERDETPWTRGCRSRITSEMPYLLEAAVPEADPTGRGGQ
jgi:hypothetical protein